ncbi:CoA transferase [Streptomyces sp. NPDC051644]|uniref:CoA transferase n=1 Tax=Streptomyces sp. NPDC051644 TaxID=3365666 RepID=UPI0037B8FFCC
MWSRSSTQCCSTSSGSATTRCSRSSTTGTPGPRWGERLAGIFAGRTREEWTAAFEGTQSCVTPVYGLTEAAGHPHNIARGTYYTENGLLQPAPAPRYQGTPAATPRPAPAIGTHTREVLEEVGMAASTIDTPVPAR